MSSRFFCSGIEGGKPERETETEKNTQRGWKQAENGESRWGWGGGGGGGERDTSLYSLLYFGLRLIQTQKQANTQR